MAEYFDIYIGMLALFAGLMIAAGFISVVVAGRLAARSPRLTDSDLSEIYTRALKSEGNVVSVPEPGPTPLASLWLVAEDDELVTTVFSVKSKGLPVAPVDTCEFLARARGDVMALCLEVAALRKQQAERVGSPDDARKSLASS